jgi:hypothetical protein
LDALTYHWNFGDGSAWATGQSATHTYTVANTYTYAVWVTDGAGGHNVSQSSTATITAAGPGYGQLRVGTSPAAPAMISIDGQWASRWGLDWVKLTPGPHVIGFGDVFGFETPQDQTVTIVDGQITEILGTFTPCALLRVVTNPAMPSTVYVNAIPRNDWGIWNYVPAGTYTVTFGLVAGFNIPAPQTVTLGIGQSATVIGEFVANAAAPGPDPATYGQLRVGTNPAVPTMIYANGNWMSHWGLDWVKLAPGSYDLTFSDVNGVATAAPHTVTIVAGQITEYVSDFPLRGTLQVATSPAAPSTIYVDGIARNDWGIWVDVNPGSYVVSFGPVPGYVTPAPQTVTVSIGANTLVWGVFVPG